MSTILLLLQRATREKFVRFKVEKEAHLCASNLDRSCVTGYGLVEPAAANISRNLPRPLPRLPRLSTFNHCPTFGFIGALDRFSRCLCIDSSNAHILLDPMAPTNSSTVADSSNGSKSNRDGTFQVLAGGSLDLTALIALFATDSVERYALDYTQGLISAAATPMSLFGILGYVKTLLKLSIGPEFCDRVGLGTKGIRPYSGLAISELSNFMPSELIQVIYLKRVPTFIGQNELAYRWLPLKTAWHTSSSMPLVRGRSWARHFYGSSLSGEEEPHGLVICNPEVRRKMLLVAVAMTLLMTSAFSSLSGLVLYPMISTWTWSSYHAVFGIMVSVTLGSLPWLPIFMCEQVPCDVPACLYQDPFLSATPPCRAKETLLDQGPSVTNSEQRLAYFKRGNAYYVFAFRTPKPLHLVLARVLSLLAAISIILAYILQFMQLQSMSDFASAIWLGVQGLLAGVRILIWYWSPKIQFLYNHLSKGFVYLCPNGGNRYSREMLSFRDSISEVELVVLEHHLKQGRQNRWMEVNPSWQNNNEESQMTTPITAWLCDMMHDFKLSACTISPATVPEGQFANVVLSTLRNAVRMANITYHPFKNWLRSRSIEPFAHGIFVQNQDATTSLLLKFEYNLGSPECPLRESERQHCSGWCSGREHDTPLIVEYFALHEESAKTVVSVRGLRSHEWHLVNGQRYFSGEHVSQEHLETCWACQQIFSRDTLAEKSSKWVEGWRRFESEEMVRRRAQTGQAHAEDRRAVAHWRQCT